MIRELTNVEQKVVDTMLMLLKTAELERHMLFIVLGRSMRDGVNLAPLSEVDARWFELQQIAASLWAAQNEYEAKGESQ